MQSISDDRWIFRMRVVSRNRDRSHLASTIVRKPHSPVFGLRQCCNAWPDWPSEFESFRTPPQEGNDFHGCYPQRARTINEEASNHRGSKVPVVPDWDPSCALAKDQSSFGAGPDSSVMIAGEAMNLGIRQFFRFGKHCQRTVSQET